MKTYIKLIITAALLLGGVSIAQADHHGGHSKTNRVDKVKVKPAPKKANPAEVRKKRHALAAKKIKDGVKAGKITEKQAKEKLAALRKSYVSGAKGSTPSTFIGERKKLNPAYLLGPSVLVRASRIIYLA